MIEAIYYDGNSTRRHKVTVIIHKRVVSLRGEEVHRTIRMSKLDISERLDRAPRILRFPDGAFLETKDPALPKLLAKNRFVEPRVVRWQNNWPVCLLALIVLVGILVSAYQWGLPWAADRVAQHLPPTMEAKIGDEGLEMMDNRVFNSSKLPPAEQDRLRALFATLKQPRAEKTPYRIEFRDSLIGPNAFALPNGVIVMTDQLVKAAGKDEAILGVLSHELGHLQRRHMQRQLLQTVGVGILLNVWAGDMSGILTGASAVLLHQAYSRDFERESDQYAIDMMRTNGKHLSPMADLFEAMGKASSPVKANSATADGSEDDEDDDADAGKKRQRHISNDYLSSHPSDDERITKLRAADQQ